MHLCHPKQPQGQLAFVGRAWTAIPQLNRCGVSLKLSLVRRDTARFIMRLQGQRELERAAREKRRAGAFS